jgi:uncharacterized membrane protein
MKPEKSLELDRLVFFSDAVVAIAITLLALELKVENHTTDFSFENIYEAWPHFLAFVLSFIIIGVFWKIHHQFFMYIGRIDEKLLGLNMLWLFGIAILPFSTNLMSEHLMNKTATIFYCANVFFISFFQNLIWDYACDKLILYPGQKTKISNDTLLKENVSKETESLFRAACNIHWINAAVALIVACFSPLVAMIILFTRIIFFRSAAIQWIGRRIKREKAFENLK